jgi:hypothetical protein
VGPERIQTVVIEDFAKLGVVVAERIAALIRADDSASRANVYLPPAYFAIEAFVVEAPCPSRAS